MSKVIFLVSNDLYQYETKGEASAMHYVLAFDSFYTARRIINQYSAWLKFPTLHRRVTPSRAINHLVQNDALLHNNCCIATYMGVNSDGETVWFSISFIKI